VASNALDLLLVARRLAAHHRLCAMVAEALCDTLGIPLGPDLAAAAALHDIGKLPLLPSLDAPGPLTAQQRATLAAHPEASAVLLGAAGMHEAARLALLHHERWDGKGYPYGIPGEATPVAARVLAAADAIAAMLEPRPYRPAPDIARELAAASGTQLDPELAAAAIRILPRLLALPRLLLAGMEELKPLDAA
jgi:putative two-component system response regulator